jgi:hypothetical protein
VNVLTVADDFGNNLIAFAACANGAGLAVMNSGHCIIKVGEVGCARFDNRLGFVVIAIGMGNGNCAELGCLFGKFNCAGKLGGNIGYADKAFGNLIKLFECFGMSLNEIFVYETEGKANEIEGIFAK